MDNQQIDNQFTEKRLSTLSKILNGEYLKNANKIIAALSPSEIANILESLPPPKRKLLWNIIDSSYAGDVLIELNEEVRQSLIQDMDINEIISATENLDIDDLADFIQSLPNTLTSEALQKMDEEDRERVEKVLSYPEDTAGGLMDTNTITVRADVTIDVVLRYLRLKGNIPRHTDMLFVTDRYGKFLGTLSIRSLLTSDPDLKVEEVMRTNAKTITPDLSAHDVALLFEEQDLISVVVLDENQHVLGRVTIDDVVDVIREEAEHSVMSMAGLDEESDLFSPILTSAKKRAVWLGINLVTAFLASSVIGFFTNVLDKVVALAVLMPIVANMGGIAGTQTLTIVIRGQALGQITNSNGRWFMMKEIGIAWVNSFLWALIAAIAVYFWFDDKSLALVIAAAMMINLLFAAFSGVAIPFILKYLNMDPALGGGVILTTITDVVGFLSFLGLASLLLL